MKIGGIPVCNPNKHLSFGKDKYILYADFDRTLSPLTTTDIFKADNPDLLQKAQKSFADTNDLLSRFRDKFALVITTGRSLVEMKVMQDLYRKQGIKIPHVNSIIVKNGAEEFSADDENYLNGVLNRNRTRTIVKKSNWSKGLINIFASRILRSLDLEPVDAETTLSAEKYSPYSIFSTPEKIKDNSVIFRNIGETKVFYGFPKTVDIKKIEQFKKELNQKMKELDIDYLFKERPIDKECGEFYTITFIPVVDNYGLRKDYDVRKALAKAKHHHDTVLVAGDSKNDFTMLNPLTYVENFPKNADRNNLDEAMEIVKRNPLLQLELSILPLISIISHKKDEPEPELEKLAKCFSSKPGAKVIVAEEGSLPATVSEIITKGNTHTSTQDKKPFQHTNNSLHNLMKNISFSGRKKKLKQDNISKKEIKLKAQELLNYFPIKKDIEVIENIISSHPEILKSDIEQIKNNINGVCTHFAAEGRLSKWGYSNACIKEPQLFSTDSDKIIRNITNIMEKFKSYGIKTEEYLEACLFKPELFLKPAEEIIENIERIQGYFKKDISPKDYCRLCLEYPQLLIDPPEKTINKINAYKYTKGKSFNILTCDYSKSTEYIYLKNLAFKDYDNEMKGRIISYYKKHPEQICHINIPKCEGYEECKRFLTDFSIKNIGRNIFIYNDEITMHPIPQKEQKTKTTSPTTTKNCSENNFTEEAVKLRHKGLLYKEIGKELGLSREYASMLVRTHCGKLLSKMNALTPEYAERAQLLIDTFPLNQSVEEVEKIIINNPILLNADVDKMKEKYEKILEAFEPYGLDREKFAQKCFSNVSLIFAKSETIINNVQKVYEEFKDTGLTLNQYIELCLENPLLFSSKYQTIIYNVTKVCETFKDNGITKEAYIKACIKRPEILSLNPEKIIEKINKTYKQFTDNGLKFKKGDYIQAALHFPSILMMAPDTVINNFNNTCIKFKEQGINIDKTSYFQACLNFPSLFVSKPSTIISNTMRVFEKFKNDGMQLDSYIKACLRYAQLFYQNPDTIINNVNGVAEFLKIYGFSKDKYIKACLSRPSLLPMKPETIIKNIKKVQSHFKQNGLTMEKYIQSCLYQPSLFSQNSETITNNVLGVYNHFKKYGFTINNYIYACLCNSRLFVQSPETIINNVETVCEHFKDKGLTVEKYLSSCSKAGSLFASKPETIISKINSYFYIHGKDSKISTSYCLYSFEHIYMVAFVLNKLKNIIPELRNIKGGYTNQIKQIIIDYYKANKNASLTIQIPDRDGAKHCMETLNKFSEDNIGRNIFNYELV